MGVQLFLTPPWLRHLHLRPQERRAGGGQLLLPPEWITARVRGWTASFAPEGPAALDLPTPSRPPKRRTQLKLRFPRRCSELPRARSLSARRYTRREREAVDELALFPKGWDRDRPQTRADCEGQARPCPWVSCRYNLYLDVADNGTLKINFPDREPLDMPPAWSCVLDVADRVRAGDPVSLDEVGKGMNLGIERVRQLSALALQHGRIKVMWQDSLVKIRRRPPAPAKGGEITSGPTISPPAQGGMLAPRGAEVAGRKAGSG